MMINVTITTKWVEDQKTRRCVAVWDFSTEIDDPLTVKGLELFDPESQRWLGGVSWKRLSKQSLAVTYPVRLKHASLWRVRYPAGLQGAVKIEL